MKRAIVRARGSQSELAKRWSEPAMASQGGHESPRANQILPVTKSTPEPTKVNKSWIEPQLELARAN